MNLSSLSLPWMATLESVVGPCHVAAWKERQMQVEDSPLAQFYTKYWGVSMKKEVKKWQKSVQDEDMDIDSEDDDNNEGDGGGDGGEEDGEQEEEDEEGEGEEDE